MAESRVVIFLRSVHGVYNYVGHKRAKLTDEKVMFKDRPFIFGAHNPAFKRGRAIIYYIDVDTGLPVSMVGSGDTAKPYDSELLDAILFKQVAKDIVMSNLRAAMGKMTMANLMIYVVVLLLGGFAGMFIQAVLKPIGG